VLRGSRIVAGIFGVTAFAWSPVANAQTCPNNVPHVTGTWVTLPYQMPVSPVSTTLLHDGRILIISGSENDASNNSPGAESYRAAIWDPNGLDQNSVAVQNLQYDVFCSGTAVLPHGRPLIVGGTGDYSFKGDNRASFFDPATQAFNQSQNMADGRWYATATALGDGRVMTIGGLGGNGGTNTKVEIFDPASPGAGWGTPTTEPFSPPVFPREFLLPNGKVFFTGQGSDVPTAKSWIFDPVAKTWTASDNTNLDRQSGAAILLPLLPPTYVPRVMNLGGGALATPSTEIIDLSAANPRWTPGPDMSTGRIHMNAVILPNGKVLAEGGSASNEIPDTPGRQAELLDSTAGAFAGAGTAAYSRLYHSTALLLPDATVVSLGSNPGDRGSYLPTVEVYTPPYLFDANDRPITNRPVITGATPAKVAYGATLSVTYTSASPISSAVLMRPGSSTHAFDMDQRMIGLCGPSPQPACAGAGTLTLTTPPNGNLAPPGFYLLFLLDAAGVPSKAQWVELTTHTGAPPSGAIAIPASDVTITAGGSVLFSTATTAAKYGWIFPGGTPASSTLQNPGSVTYATAGRYVASLNVVDASGDSDPSPPTRQITVRPATADFDIEVSPPSLSVVPGGSATFTVTVTPLSGFTGTVSLSVGSESGFPAGITSGGFAPPSVPGSGTSTLTMNTTTSATPYALSLTITGTSGTRSHTASTSLLVNVAVPSGLTAAPSNGQVALSWQPSAGASGYQVQRSRVSGGPYQTIGCPTPPAFTDSGLTNGTTYYYVVSASFTGGPNSGGESAASSELAVSPPCPVPGYSGSLGASRSAGSTTWVWTSGGAVRFDLVRGDLATLRASGGDFNAALAAVPAGEAACLANDTPALSVIDPYPDPSPGGGTFAVLRAVTTACPAQGSYDDGSPTLARSRNPGIVASSRACP
jgi:hypothetical protein